MWDTRGWSGRWMSTPGRCDGTFSYGAREDGGGECGEDNAEGDGEVAAERSGMRRAIYANRSIQ